MSGRFLAWFWLRLANTEIAGQAGQGNLLIGSMDMDTLLQGQKGFWLYEKEPCVIFPSKVRRLNYSSAGVWVCSTLFFPFVIMTLIVPEILLKPVDKVPAATLFHSEEAQNSLSPTFSCLNHCQFHLSRVLRDYQCRIRPSSSVS